ncbi:MAG: hypothetical protein AAGA75_07575 [Cyanobacteria bacterium P01_E01_bin.6]
MGRRFSDIRQAPRLQAAQTQYLAYQGTYRPPNINSRGARNANLSVYVHPFGLPYTAGEVYTSKMNGDHYPILSPLVTAQADAAVTDTLGTDTLISSRGFRAARVVWFRNETRVVETPTSNITGQEYLKYNGTRLSIPFGAAGTGDIMLDAFNGIKAAALATAGFEVSRVSLQREFIPT